MFPPSSELGLSVFSHISSVTGPVPAPEGLLENAEEPLYILVWTKRTALLILPVIDANDEPFDTAVVRPFAFEVLSVRVCTPVVTASFM